MLRWKTLAAFIGVMAFAGLTSAAPTIMISDVIGQSFSGSVASSGPFTSLGNGQVNGATLYRVDFFAKVTGATATQTFGATTFDVMNSGTPGFLLNTTGPSGIYQGTNGSPGNGLTTGARKTWTPNNPAMTDVGDSGGNAIATLFTGGVASDAGVGGDYLALTSAIDPSNLGQTTSVSLGTPVHDPRLDIGATSTSPNTSNGTFLLGSLWVYPGSAPTTLTVANASYLIADSSVHQLLTPAVNITGIAGLTIPGVPEPTSIVLMGLGALGLVGAKLRRR
jgi:hypothetical protein